jgi:hypothetical protein
MLKLINNKLNRMSAVSAAAFTMGLSSAEAYAAAPASGGNSFNTIAKNITTGIEQLPGFLAAISYMMGMIFSVLGILKIKDHVENPSQTPLKDGAIRLAVGGGLFAIPIITDAMTNLIGDGDGAKAAELNKIEFGVKK